ncbi:polygalacturonase [Ginsengibacter hankyongi]|uniref:Polygalacturonase n=2 Tax=Ginsengibacter hankyongi TaxID=2607284 RepID=A0A5J5IHM4_9BACT|nr:polygalacturonase [Ginsengibacter hankyongi]
MVQKIFFCVLICLSAKEGVAKDFLITDFGAKPGVDELNTIPINDAIDACYKNGGGRVIVPAGIFKTGTLVLKDNVELHLEIGSVLFASINRQDFPLQPQPIYHSLKDAGGWRALIYALGASHIAITGYGTIDGNGANLLPGPGARPNDLDGRPRNILFISCKNIAVEGVHMRNSGIWNQHYLDCEDVVVDKINVYNHANRNNDGIDIDGCRRFILSNSVFDTDDDAVCLKSTGPAPCEDVVITNCIVSSFCNAIKTGTESTGGFKNISISNCVIKPSRAAKRLFGDSLGITGISLEIVDGGIMDGINVSNIVIEGTQCPIYVRLGNRARKYNKEAPTPPPGQMRNIQINNVTAYTTGNYSSSITGVKGAIIENISLDNIRITNAGNIKPGEYRPDYSKVKEDEKGYPQPTVWGNLPSYGFFIRHVKGISLSNVTLSSVAPDLRFPIIAVDVENLLINHISLNKKNSKIDILLNDVKNYKIDNRAINL